MALLNTDTIAGANGTDPVDFPTGLTVSATRSSVFLSGANGYGGTATKIRRYSNNTVVGTNITYADSATNGASLTINVAGVYAITIVDNFSGASNVGISLNSANLTTNIQSLTAGEQIAWSSTGGANFGACVGAILKLNVNDVIRPHTDGAAVGTVTQGVYFRIVRVL